MMVMVMVMVMLMVMVMVRYLCWPEFRHQATHARPEWNHDEVDEVHVVLQLG